MDGVSYSDFSDMSWQDISSQIDMDMEAFSGKIGLNVGTFQVNLTVANRKRYDYRAFLKRFSALSEEMKTSPDEFDYIYYVRAFAIQEHASSSGRLNTRSRIASATSSSPSTHRRHAPEARAHLRRERPTTC